MKAARLLLAAALVAGESLAQVPAPYADGNDRLVESLVFPIGRRDFVHKTMEYCGAKYDDLRIPSLIAYAHWVRRHAGFLQMTEALRRYLSLQAQKDPAGKGAQWQRLLGHDIPKQIEKLESAAIVAIEAQPNEEARRALCTSTLAAASELKLDLDWTDPELALYLRRVAARNGVQVPPAGTDPTTGPTAARRNAAALKGTWRTEKVLYYFPDGTERQADGTCTLTFEGAQATSDCEGVKGPYTVRYGLQTDDAGRYASEILTHSANPGAAGSRADGLFRVEDKTLHISVFPLSGSGDGKQPVEIESVAVLKEDDKR